MDINTNQVIMLTLTELERLDPVRVILEDIEAGKGRIIITCYGKAWTAYWGGMGDQTISQFFYNAPEEYLAGNLSNISKTTTDYDAISKAINEDVDSDSLHCHTSQLEDHYGVHWRLDLPEKENHPYTYLCRIIKAVQTALKEIDKEGK